MGNKENIYAEIKHILVRKSGTNDEFQDFNIVDIQNTFNFGYQEGEIIGNFKIMGFNKKIIDLFSCNKVDLKFIFNENIYFEIIDVCINTEVIFGHIHKTNGTIFIPAHFKCSFIKSIFN